jgi:polyisoprenoid-binding protein YceI
MSTSAFAPASTITWKIDPAHSHAEFKVKHMMISNVKGSFNGLTALSHPGLGRQPQNGVPLRGF